MKWPSPHLCITRLDIGDSSAPVFAPIKFRVEFEVDPSLIPLENVYWQFTYMFDLTFEKKLVGTYDHTAVELWLTDTIVCTSLCAPLIACG